MNESSLEKLTLKQEIEKDTEHEAKKGLKPIQPSYGWSDEVITIQDGM